MDVGQHLGPIGLPEEGDHRHHDEQSFQSLTQQNGQGAEEAGEIVRLLRRERPLGRVKQGVQTGDPLRDFFGGRALADRGAQRGHGRLDPAQQRPVTGTERGLHRFEAVEIGRQRQVRGGLAVAAMIGRLAFREARSRQGQGRPLGTRRRLGVTAKIGRHRTCLRLADPARQIRRRGRGDGGQIGVGDAERRVGLPEALAFGGFGVSKGEAADIEGQGPTILCRQMGEAGHRRPIEPLVDHLVETEHAALAGAFHVGEGDRRRIESFRARAVGAAGRAMTDCALFGIERRALRQIGRK